MADQYHAREDLWEPFFWAVCGEKTGTCEYMLHFCAKIHIRPCSVRKSLPYKLVTRPPSGGTRRDLKRRGAVVQKIRMGNFFLQVTI